MWEDAGPRGTVHVREAVALDAAAAHALWSRLLDLDLMASVHVGMLPADDALLGLLVDTRAGERRVSDNVWVRVVDVPAALAARRYAADVDVTLAVRDERLASNTGTWRVRARAFEADVHVERTQAPRRPRAGRTRAGLGVPGRARAHRARAGRAGRRA